MRFIRELKALWLDGQGRQSWHRGSESHVAVHWKRGCKSMSRRRIANRLDELERANQETTQRFQGVLTVPYAIEQKGPKAVTAWMRDHGFESAVMLPDVRPKETDRP